MTRQESLHPNWRQIFSGNSSEFPQSFAEVVAIVKTLILDEFDREIAQKQLYYHTREHINGVQRRANQIFQAIDPTKYFPTSPDVHTRMQLLLNLCVTAHDLVQEFIPLTDPHTSRRREAGVNESLTVRKLGDYIHSLNHQLREHHIDESLLFTEADLSIIEEAILATICLYDPSEQAIYQPALDETNQNLSVIARILALADIGTLGMEGITAYNEEGSLLFLEENPDIIPLILEGKIETLENPQLGENIRQRLLRRARFQINFARSRLLRCPRELIGFPPEVIPILNNKIFPYLKQENIEKIVAETPSHEDTPLEVLLKFFDFEKFITQER